MCAGIAARPLGIKRAQSIWKANVVQFSKQEFLGLEYDLLGTDRLVDELLEYPPKAPFAYVVTPNVDHIVRLHDTTQPDHEAIVAAYRAAHWCVCDSRVLALLARRLGLRLPVAPGSDVTARLLPRLSVGTKVAVVGSTPLLLAALAARYPALIFSQHEPPMGLRFNPAALQQAADFAVAAAAPVTLLAVGAPQQELLAHEIGRRPDATGVGLCIGAAVDFLVGQQRRAPVILQRLALEWLFRLATDPRRLARRYLITGPRVFALVRAAAARSRVRPK